ncbi:hypothetical protein EJ03DRAFT_331894 [Teratosphaeria nubilosa]|uniref:Helicase C-terminal domain-containing protein n=1 Tax=Teratosphaeria nubilosa TaxID=161662 RepID=A0A6G1KUT4_9PEZI|nr:hypothetical protein EJ03DRAFT_331894 [Teratosphaeria nubilosa]
MTYQGTSTASFAGTSSDHMSNTSGVSPASDVPYFESSSESKTADLSADAIHFRSDLNNYLALGCLIFEDFTQDADTNDDTGDSAWRDVDLSEHSRISASLYSQLAKLVEAGWLRIQTNRSVLDPQFVILRIFVLPEDAGHRFIDRTCNKKLWIALEALVLEVDISESTWQGRYTRQSIQRKFDAFATSDEGSLFYMFNTLPSPAPDIETVKEKYAREALEDLLDPALVLPGLKTALYPYQRRSAGLMLQRETVSKLALDPRLEPRTAPDGSIFCYGARHLLFLRHPRYYEACKGGILAETMGLGKTVILLSTILATKDHAPKVPAPYSLPQIRPVIGSLAAMAASAITRKSIPWKVELQRLQHATGNDFASCRNHLTAYPPSYQIPQLPQRWNRKTIQPPPKRMILASTSIVVVPRNLFKQWQSEIQKHVDTDYLRVLVMEDSRRALPPAEELCTYDLILFSRNRFELEKRDGSDEQGRRISSTQLVCRCPYIGATRTRDCHCVRSDDLYDSPLKHVHFKRLVVDEGHFFAHSNTVAVAVANELITADHRWVISGTPARDLLGVEVDMSSLSQNTLQTADDILDHRRSFNQKEDTSGAIKSLGALASSFLKIRPWCAQSKGVRKEAEWDDHVYRHEDLRKRTYSGFSSRLRRTLESMVVKTQPKDVEKDILLPPLSHRVVRLEPSYYDKLTANLFTLVLTANAVTSERTDADYLFHKNSAKSRYQLIYNLRQSAFFWTGFSEDDIHTSLNNSTGYLAKDGTLCTEEDRELLTSMLACADKVIACEGWKSMSRSHELGVFIDSWPEESADHWAFDEARSPLMTGISQLLEAQKQVNKRAAQADPGDGLSGAGIRLLAPVRHAAVKQQGSGKQSPEKPVLTKAGIPTSTLNGDSQILRRRLSSSGQKKGNPKAQQKVSKFFNATKARTTGSKNALPRVQPECSTGSVQDRASFAHCLPSAAGSSRKRKHAEIDHVEFDPKSPYLKSRIVGTTSAKLSYLISQIVRHHKEEKILVFYDGDNVAYYVAQMLELLQIRHKIYAKSLPAHLKSEYVVRFDQEPQDRVLLMDVKQAAFGLNLSSASRIYFINPVCRPNIEAQAIKRAHRIGQTRSVFVETLVLKGSIEEKMLKRSEDMTSTEHRDAKFLEDDGGIKDIIQSARLLPVHESEMTGHGQMAPLEESQQLWGREGWKDSVLSPQQIPKKKKVTIFEDITDADQDARLVEDDEAPLPQGIYERRRAFVDCTSVRKDQVVLENDSDDEPVLGIWRKHAHDLGSSGKRHKHISVRAEKRIRFDRDLFLPQIRRADRLAPAFSPLHSPEPQQSRSSVDETLPGSKPSYCGMTIKHLVNQGDARAAIAPDALDDEPAVSTRPLLQEIIRRL